MLNRNEKRKKKLEKKRMRQKINSNRMENNDRKFVWQFPIYAATIENLVHSETNL